MIPKKIFQTWKSKILAPPIATNVEEIRNANPEYEYQLFDDEDCRKYLLEHFGAIYVRAFDELESGAFKADLWRYAVLYKEGGVYIDLDMKLLTSLDNILKAEESTELVSIVDKKKASIVPCAVYQAFIACIPGHMAVYYALQISLYNILTHRIPDTDCIDITGPIVFGRGLNIYWNRNSEMDITPGIYDEGKIKLYRVGQDLEYTYDLHDRKIIKNKMVEYNRGHIYWMNDYYKTKNRVGHNYRLIEESKLRMGVVLLVVVIVLVTLLSYKVNCYVSKKYE